MAAIVYLDVDDEITSAAARIRTLTDDRIALVLPLGSRLSTSRINFRLLAREAEARGKRLEVVTGDASARALAASAGLATHVSVAAFEGRVPDGALAPGAAAEAPAATPTGAARTAPPTASARRNAVGGAGQLPLPMAPPAGPGGDDSPTAPMPALRGPGSSAPVPQVGHRPRGAGRSRTLAIVLLLVAVLFGAATAGFLLLPSATVTLVPATKAIGPLHLNVTAQTGVTQPDPVNLLVPATMFSFDVQASDTFPATDVKVTETSASGEVTFENCDTGGGVTIPAGATVSTSDGVRFATDARISLKRAHVFPFACDAGSVPVTAVVPGLTGNVAANAINQIPAGYDPVVLRVTNQAATTGGTHTETKQVSQADVNTAMATLTTTLQTSFTDKITSAQGVPQGTTLYPETKTLGTTTPSPDPKTLVGTVEDTFQLGLAATGTVIGVDPAPVSTLADARLRSLVASGFTLVDSSIDMTIQPPIVVGPTITFPVTIGALAIRTVDRAALRAKIRGLGVPEARSALAPYGDVSITVWPDWVSTIPTNDSRVTFTVATPSPGASASPGISPSSGARPPATGTAPVSSPAASPSP